MSPSTRPRQPRGITLAVVLVVMAGMLLMAVGVLAVVGIERKTARSYIDAKRAEWIAQAGMENVRGLLREQTANDDFLIAAGRRDDGDGSRQPLDYLFLARGEAGDEGVDWSVFPLFSATGVESQAGSLGAAVDPDDYLDGAVEEIEMLPWAEPARIAWMPVEDEEGRIVGRYAYWVEDLQGRVAPALHPQAEFDEDRPEFLFPAGGMVDPGIPELGLHALDPGAGDEDTSELDDRLIDGRELMISPDSALAAAEFRAPLERGADGRLEDGLAAAVEENVAAGVRDYAEQPRVPFAEGIDPELAGEPKLNLNELLEGSRTQAIEEFAEQVRRGLPRFDERKGGFPDDYVATLAANALDYADLDTEGSVREGEYRGLDAYPLISEHLIRFRWEDLPIIDGRKYLVLSGTVYAEFWNMTNQPVRGEAQVSYETHYSFDLGVVPDLNLGSPDFLEDPEVVSPVPEKSDGYYWLPPFDLELEPNEYRLVKVGTITYTIDAGPSSVWVSSPMELRGEDLGEVGYRMKWNGTMVDQSRGNVKHPDIIINYPLDTKSKPRQGVWTTIPGHSYSVGRFDYVNNMGDPRIAYYIGIAQDPNDYPDNYSPNRRTIRYGNVYSGDSSTKPKVYGRVMPSEWPDGGHNTAYGSLPAAVAAGRGSSRGDERVDPDDEQFFRNLPEVEPTKAVTRLSNLGRFYSATELGRIYDPVMWVPTFDNPGFTNQIRDGRMPPTEPSWPDVTEGAPASDQYGGGNTLRIGRPEHPKFREPGLHAAHLLDLFHAGDPAGDEGTGGVEWIRGRINVNTATRDALRVMMVGLLKQDPALARRLSSSHQPTDLMAPPTQPTEVGTPAIQRAADGLADAILRERPFASAAELASVEDSSGRPVFGNRELHELGDKLEWNDAAAEEVFSRLYHNSTLRSRNFRVWVVGQALVPRDSGSTAAPVVLAESRKVFTLFADPGERDEEDRIDPANYRPKILYENDF